MSGIQTYPTFLVIGAQKCGTNWLAKMISQHPEVSVPTKKSFIFFDKIHKELHFFNQRDHYGHGLEWYKKWFKITPATRAAGEFTPNYFWQNEDWNAESENKKPWVIPDIVHQHYPNLKLIVSLRDPVDRAISAYYHHIRKRRVSPNQRILSVADRHGIISMGYYDIYLRQWLKYYSLDDFLILIYEEELKDENKKATLKKIFKHISVHDAFKPKNIYTRYYQRNTHFELRLSHYPLPSMLRKFLPYIVPSSVKKNKRWKIHVSEEEKATLRDIFISHKKNLEKMIKRKLPWLNPA